MPPRRRLKPAPTTIRCSRVFPTTRSSARRSSATPAASAVFSAATKSETAPFKGEPTRESLTQPPSGYQTPSPNFAYGTGPKESLNKEYNPAAGKYGE